MINAGVVGYSTYQELLLLQKDVLTLRPDVVLVNYCGNDALPTEDPFGNARQIHIEYLSRLLERHDPEFTPEEASRVRQLIDAFGSGRHVWQTLGRLQQSSPKWVELIRKVFVEMPMARMAELSRSAGARLIYVFIPPRSNRADYAATVEELKELLRETGAEFVDVQAALAPDADELGWERIRRSALAWVWPGELRQILRLWNIRTIQRRDKFLDLVHPTARGNTIVAAAIHRHLTDAWAR